MATPNDRPQPAVKGAGPEVEEVATGNLDKVRDILFGGQLRDYDRRFARLEERLVKELADLKEDMRKRMAALEHFAKTETEALAETIKNERDERTDAAKDLSRELRETSKAFEKKTGQLDEQLSRAQRELRQQVLDLHQSLSDDMRQNADDLIARLTQETGELRAGKADRVAVAALLTEMAVRLASDSPGADAEE